MERVVIDAKNKSAGRVAVEAVAILRGKNKPDFAPNKLPDVLVTIINASYVLTPQSRLNTKVYLRHSGAPGGFRGVSLKKVKEEKPERILRFAVSGMLPKNRLRARALKRLRVFRGEAADELKTKNEKVKSKDKK